MQDDCHSNVANLSSCAHLHSNNNPQQGNLQEGHCQQMDGHVVHPTQLDQGKRSPSFFHISFLIRHAKEVAQVRELVLPEIVCLRWFRA
jgi:hypothetical protein